MSTKTKTPSYSERLQAAMKVTTQAEADTLFSKLVELCLQDGKMTRKRAFDIQKQNLGYFAGYYDSETRARVEKLFRCSHPVFGPIADNGSPTVEQAFELGRQLGKQAKGKA